MKVIGLQNWQVLQQVDGRAAVCFDITLDGWFENPVTEAEIKFSEKIYGINIRVVDETTGDVVVPWQEFRVNNRRCTGTIADIPTGGPYVFQTQYVFYNGSEFNSWSGENVACHVGVGDIFLIAGQSNAVGCAKETYYEEPDINVRKLDSSGKWDMAFEPLGDVGYSPFLTFAKQISKLTGYPTGLIPRAVGGSAVSTWVNGGVHLEKVKAENIENIKGVLWYQGCTDAEIGLWETYKQSFSEFAGEIRKKFNNSKLPIITFQLNRNKSCKNDPAKNMGYDNIREIQRQIPKELLEVYVIPTVDMMKMSDSIHNSVSSNKLLGERAADFAADVIYKQKSVYRAPDIEKITQISDVELELEFSNVVNRLTAYGVSPHDLPVCVQDSCGESCIVDYEIKNNKILLKLERPIDLSSAFVKAEYGSDPLNVIIDDESRLPVLCFTKQILD